MNRFILLALFLLLLNVQNAISQPFAWAKSLGDDVGPSIVNSEIDENGNYLITGTFRGTKDFDPGPDEHLATATPESIDVYVLKLSNTGEFLWVVTFGSDDVDYPRSVAVDNNDDVYVIKLNDINKLID